MPDPAMARQAKQPEPMNAATIASVNPEASIMIVGDSGTHKTYFLSTIPGIFIYDFDRRMAIARGRNVLYRTFRDAPYGSRAISPDNGIYKWGEGYPRFLDHINYIGEQIDKGALPYQALGLDSMTTLAMLVKNYVQSGVSKTPKDSVTQPEWGQIMDLMEAVISQVTAWPLLKIATAHISRNENENMGGTVEYMPYMPGKKLAPKLPVFFDEWWFSTRDDKETDMIKKFKFITETKGMFKSAKTTYGVPDGSVADWSAIGKYFTQG